MRDVRDFLVGAVYGLLGLLLGPFFGSSKPAFQPQRIVILKPCCIGDVLMSTPLVRELRIAFPGACLDYAVGQWSEEAIRSNPNIDGFIDCGPIGSGRPYGWRDYWSLVESLKKGKYDTCFVLERSSLLALIPFLAGIPNRIGIDSGGRGFSHTVKVPWKTMRHEAELYLDLARAVGREPAGSGLQFCPTDFDISWARKRLAGKFSALSADSKVPLIAIHPGGAANPGMTLAAKRWPLDRYALLIERFLASGWGVVLVGAESDKTLIGQVIGLLSDSSVSSLTDSRLLSLGGETSLGQLGGVYKNCDLFVGNDTGPMHLAVACGIPVVAVFGPSTPEMYGPFGPNSIAVYKQVDCSPCFLNGRFAVDCSHHRCMEAVAVEDVWLAAQSLVEQGHSSRAPQDARCSPGGT